MVDNITGDTQQITDAANASAGALGLLGTSIKETQDMFAAFSGSLGDIGASLRGTSVMTREMANSAQVLGAAIFKSADAFKSFGDAGRTGFQSMAAPIDAMIGSAEKMATATYTALGKRVPESVQLAIDKMKDLSATMAGAQNMQNAYIQMMMASGQATQLFTAGGSDLSKLGGILKNTTDVIQDATKQLAISSQEAGAFYQGIGKIPGALDEATTKFGGAVNGMTPWIAAIRVAQGAGMDLGEAVKQQAQAYDLLGKVGDDATEFMARQGELSQQLHIPLQKTTGYLDEMADKFKYLGDNTKGASEVMMQMFDRLRASGIGVDPAIAQVKQMTGAMADLTVAQEAFLSSRTGGPGGLQGAMQIENLLRDPTGKGAAEVMKKAQDALKKQFGGHIVTTQEAGTSQQAASQFERQRQLLQSGNFGIGAGTDKNQAANLINALAKPETGKSPEAAKDAIEKLAQQGKSAEDINKTLLTGMGADIRSLKEKGGLETLAMLKKIAGVSNEEAKKMLKQEEAEAATEGVQVSEASKTGTDMSAKTTTGNVAHLVDRISSGFTSAIKSYAAQPGGEFTTAPTAAETASAQTTERNRIRRQIQSAPASTTSSTGSASTLPSKSVQSAAMAASKSAGKTSAAAPAQATPRATPSTGKQPIVVNASIYVDGRLVQKSTSHHMQHEIAGDDAAKQP